MTKSKRIFMVVMVLFFAGLVILGYDISRRTTFPGSKPQLQERIKKDYLNADSLKNDSIK